MLAEFSISVEIYVHPAIWEVSAESLFSSFQLNFDWATDQFQVISGQKLMIFSADLLFSNFTCLQLTQKLLSFRYFILYFAFISHHRAKSAETFTFEAIFFYFLLIKDAKKWNFRSFIEPLRRDLWMDISWIFQWIVRHSLRDLSSVPCKSFSRKAFMFCAFFWKVKWRLMDKNDHENHNKNIKSINIDTGKMQLT